MWLTDSADTFTTVSAEEDGYINNSSSQLHRRIPVRPWPLWYTNSRTALVVSKVGIKLVCSIHYVCIPLNEFSVLTNIARGLGLVLDKTLKHSSKCNMTTLNEKFEDRWFRLADHILSNWICGVLELHSFSKYSLNHDNSRRIKLLIDWSLNKLAIHMLLMCWHSIAYNYPDVWSGQTPSFVNCRYAEFDHKHARRTKMISCYVRLMQSSTEVNKQNLTS